LSLSVADSVELSTAVAAWVVSFAVGPSLPVSVADSVVVSTAVAAGAVSFAVGP
jgi:hypothetical protein